MKNMTIFSLEEIFYSLKLRIQKMPIVQAKLTIIIHPKSDVTSPSN